jgi:hypothetical protein
MASLQHADVTPEAEETMAYLRAATTLVEEKSVTRQAITRAINLIDLSAATSPPIMEEIDQNNPDLPKARGNGARDTDLRNNIDKIRCARDTYGYIDQRYCEHEE